MDEPTFWAMVGAFATIVTAGIVFAVFKEAQAIRHIEWLSRSVQLWQGFNQMLLDDERAARWRRLLDGTLREEELRPADRYVLYSYANIIYTEYRYLKKGVLDRGYADTSVRENLRQLGPNRDFIIQLLRRTGYDLDFVQLLEKETQAAAAGPSIPSDTE